MIIFSLKKNYLKSGLFLVIQLFLSQLFAQQIVSPKLSLINHYPGPVITIKHPGSDNNKFGFEGGTAVKINGTYHLFSSEMSSDPFWVKMRHGYWKSTDKINWERVSTIRESSGEFEGKDPRASLWSPMVYFDSVENRWNQFYVAYHAEPNTGNIFRWNEKGRIYRAISQTPGISGIEGPYQDVAILMEPGPDSQVWEGLQGVDSFYPWKAGEKYYAFYGSVLTGKWMVGMASAPKLAGPWRRMETNPSSIEPRFIENPIITRLSNGTFICVYDNDQPDAIGWASSADGINWSRGNSLVIQPQPGQWSKDIRTPLGLIDEGNNRFTIFYTGFEQTPDWGSLLSGNTQTISCAIGFAEIEIEL